MEVLAAGIMFLLVVMLIGPLVPELIDWFLGHSV